jgi:hypothetical protein
MPKMTQTEYLAILLADNGYSTASQRRGYFQRRFGRDYADELTIAERSFAIQELKDGPYMVHDYSDE